MSVDHDITRPYIENEQTKIVHIPERWTKIHKQSTVGFKVHDEYSIAVNSVYCSTGLYLGGHWGGPEHPVIEEPDHDKICKHCLKALAAARAERAQ